MLYGVNSNSKIIILESKTLLKMRIRMNFRLMLLSGLLIPALLTAQKPADFSGTWTQDAEKSDDFYKEFGITNVISQTPQSITFKLTFFDKEGKEVTTMTSSFNLDGKEVSREEQGGINKEQATWSDDKKTLTLFLWTVFTVARRRTGENDWSMKVEALLRHLLR